MIQDGSLAILGFSGLSMARPCVLFPVPRYLRGRQARSVRTGFYFSAVKVSNPGRCLPHSPLPTHLSLMARSFLWLMVKSCSLWACFISSERPYKKWSIPRRQTTGTGGLPPRSSHSGLCPRVPEGTGASHCYFTYVFQPQGHV